MPGEQPSCNESTTTIHSGSIDVRWEGPYGELSLDLECDRYRTVVLVSGGVGVAAHLPLAHALCRDAQAGRPLTRLHVVWACSDAAMLHALLTQMPPQPQPGSGDHIMAGSVHWPVWPAAVHDVGAGDGHLCRSSEVYLTRCADSEFADAIVGVAATVAERSDGGGIDISGGAIDDSTTTAKAREAVANSCVRRGRPDVSTILQAATQHARTQAELRVAVLVCGPATLVNDVRRLARNASVEGMTIDVHSSAFEL